MPNAPCHAAEKQVAQKLMPVRSHHDQIALNLLGKADDLIGWITTGEVSGSNDALVR